MKEQSDSGRSRRIYADELCKDAIVFVLIGFCLFVFSFLLAYLARNIPDKLIIIVGLLIPTALIYVFAPIFGIFALIDIIVKWRTITNSDYISSNQERLYLTEKRFIIASLLFSFVVLFTTFLGLFLGGIKEAIMRAYFFILFLMPLIALVMALVSYKLSGRISKEAPVRIRAVFPVILSIATIALGIRATGSFNYLKQRVIYLTGTPTFSGSSDSLKQTSVVPTLDSPIEENKNIIWCSTFQLAWNRMKDDVIGEPVQVVGADELAARLNTAKQSSEDLESYSFYAIAGRIKQGIVDKIKKDMANKFPSHTVPEFDIDIPEAILAYSYLVANVPFEYPFRQRERGFFFTDSNGIKTDVCAFGVWGHEQQYAKIREQVEILFYQQDFNERNSDKRMKEFAIDLCRNSAPYQVVAAVVEPKNSLAETLDYIRDKTADFKKNSHNKDAIVLEALDILIMPEMFWEIDHRFDELIGKVVANDNPPMPIIVARQGIKFKLDRCGAMLESKSLVMVAAIPRYFKFNRPFLVYMKKRGCKEPFFVMWVDNAELLTKIWKS